MMRKWTLGAFVGLVALGTNPAFGVVTIQVGSAVPAGETVSIDVTLGSGGDSVGGMQNDILFDSSVVNLASASACRINAAIGTNQPGCEEDPVVGACKTLSRNLVNCGTSPTAPGCDGQPATTSRFRGIIAATAVPNNNEIPDGSVLYTCDFTVVNAGALPATLTNSNVVASDPTGTRLDSTGGNGSIGGEVTPTPGPSVCDNDVCVDVATVTLPAAGTAMVDVVVSGDNVGGAQNDILFDSTKVSLASASACRINADIGTNQAGCEEDPVVGPCKTLSRNLVNCGESPTAPGCDGQPATTSRFRGIIAATAVPNNNPIPSGTVLYTCEFTANESATLTNQNVVASDPFGTRLDAGGLSGAIILGGDTPTPTPTDDGPPTATPVPPTNTPIPPTNTPVPPTNTPVTPATAAPTATATSPATLGDDDDGCHISATRSSSGVWWLLVPALGLLALRRRES